MNVRFTEILFKDLDGDESGDEIDRRIQDARIDSYRFNLTVNGTHGPGYDAMVAWFGHTN